MPYRTEGWYVTTAGTNAGATATKAAVTGVISASTADCRITITGYTQQG